VPDLWESKKSRDTVLSARSSERRDEFDHRARPLPLTVHPYPPSDRHQDSHAVGTSATYRSADAGLSRASLKHLVADDHGVARVRLQNELRIVADAAIVLGLGLIYVDDGAVPGYPVLLQS
jgi:hypothetical protein